MASSGYSILALALAAVFSASSAISCATSLYPFSSLYLLPLPLHLYFIAMYMFIFFLSVYLWKKKWVESDSKMKELQKSLNSALEKCAAERQGRIRAQQVPPCHFLFLLLFLFFMVLLFSFSLFFPLFTCKKKQIFVGTETSSSSTSQV